MAKAKTPAKKPRTHRFVKDIVTEGWYHVTGPDGKLVKKFVPRERLIRMVETAQKLRARGFKIPAPWKHDKNVVIAKFEEGNGGLLEDSTANGGFWDSLIGKVNAEGKYQVSGVIDVPGHPDDADTPAGKVGTTVTETSIYMKGSHQLTDEEGDTLQDVPMHIALVTHAIEPGQTNFELVGDDMTIAMSHMVPDDSPEPIEEGEMEDSKPNDDADLGSLMNTATDLLGTVAKIYVTKTDEIKGFFNSLISSLEQMKLLKGGKDGSGSSDSSQTFTMEPIVMAKLSNEQIEALLKGEKNPATGKPFTKEELSDTSAEPKAGGMSAEDQATLKNMNLMMSQMAGQLTETKRQSYRDRTNTLIERGVLPKAQAEAKVFPLIEKYQPLVEGSDVALDTILMSLESVPTKDNFANDLSAEEVYEAGSFDPSTEDGKFTDDVTAEVLSLVSGFNH